MKRWRVTESRVQVVIVEADNEEEAKMLAWMTTNRSQIVRLAVTHQVEPEVSEPSDPS